MIENIELNSLCVNCKSNSRGRSIRSNFISLEFQSVCRSHLIDICNLFLHRTDLYFLQNSSNYVIDSIPLSSFFEQNELLCPQRLIRSISYFSDSTVTIEEEEEETERCSTFHICLIHSAHGTLLEHRLSVGQDVEFLRRLTNGEKRSALFINISLSLCPLLAFSPPSFSS